MVARSYDASAALPPLSSTVGSSDPPFLTTTFGGGQGFCARDPALLETVLLEPAVLEAAFVEPAGLPAAAFSTVGAVEQSGVSVFLWRRGLAAGGFAEGEFCVWLDGAA